MASDKRSGGEVRVGPYSRGLPSGGGSVDVHGYVRSLPGEAAGRADVRAASRSASPRGSSLFSGPSGHGGGERNQDQQRATELSGRTINRNAGSIGAQMRQEAESRRMIVQANRQASRDHHQGVKAADNDGIGGDLEPAEDFVRESVDRHLRERFSGAELARERSMYHTEGHLTVMKILGPQSRNPRAVLQDHRGRVLVVPRDLLDPDTQKGTVFTNSLGRTQSEVDHLVAETLATKGARLPVRMLDDARDVDPAEDGHPE